MQTNELVFFNCNKKMAASSGQKLNSYIWKALSMPKILPNKQKIEILIQKLLWVSYCSFISQHVHLCRHRHIALCVQAKKKKKRKKGKMLECLIFKTVKNISKQPSYFKRHFMVKSKGKSSQSSGGFLVCIMVLIMTLG